MENMFRRTNEIYSYVSESGMDLDIKQGADSVPRKVLKIKAQSSALEQKIHERVLSNPLDCLSLCPDQKFVIWMMRAL